MPIEVRQLSIKVNVTDQERQKTPGPIMPRDIEQLKELLFHDLLEEILEKIDQDQRR